MSERPARLKVAFAASESAAGEPEWRSLPYGVQVQLRRETGLVSAAIQARVAQDLYAFRQGLDVLGRYGFSEDEAGLLADPAIASGFAMLLEAIVRGEFLIADWNLVDEAEEPIPVTGATLKAFFNDGPIPGTGGIILAAFLRLTDEPRITKAAEGNGSASSLNGATAGGPNTAAAAASSETPAPLADPPWTVGDAQKPKTPRKRRKG